MKLQDKHIGILLCLGCVILWSLIPVVAKTGQNNLDHHSFLFYSSLVSFITLYFLTQFTKDPKKKEYSLFKDKGEFFYLIVLGLLGTYIYYLFLYYGYKTSNGTQVLILQYTWPIFIVIFSTILFKEPVSGKKIFGLFLGFIGVSMAITKGNISFQFSYNYPSLKAMTLVLIGSMCFALFSVLSKNLKKDTLHLTSFYFLCATIFSFISMALFSKIKLPPPNTIVPILINGCLVNGISYVMWIKALKKISPYIAASLVFLTPIFAAAYLIIFFNEPFNYVYILSLILIITSGLFCIN